MRGSKHSRRSFADSRRRLAGFRLAVRTISIAVVVATLVVAAGQRFGLLERLELDAYDALLRSIPDLGPDDRLLIVALTGADMVRYGHPLTDETLARLIGTIRGHGPRAVALGLYRNIDYPPGTALLAEQLRAPELVAKRFIGTDPEVGEVPAPAAVPEQNIGFSDLVVDPDGVVRRALLYVHGEPGYFSFALRSVLVARPLAAEAFGVVDEALLFGEHAVPRLRAHSGGYADADNGGYQTMLRYRSRREPAEVVPVREVLDGRLRREQVEGRIVLIGTTAASLVDEFYTPYSAGLEDDAFTMAGVTVEGQIVSQLLDVIDGEQARFSHPGRIGEWAWIAMWAALAALLAWSMRHPALMLLSIPIAPLAIAVFGGWALARLYWPPLVAPAFAAVVAAVVVAAEKYLRRTTHDPVTGLPGRGQFLKRIRSAMRQPETAADVAVAFLDVDRFQVINKAMGHAAGDRLLALIADRLRAWSEDDRDLGRLGGDEFGVLFRGIDTKAVEERIGEMRRMLAAPLKLGSRELSVSVSVGVAFAGTGERDEAGGVLRDAHTAMYRAKARKEVQLEIFSPDMGDQALARIELESDLLDAMRNREFFLVYQPVVEMGSGALSAFEALLRWQHPVRGPVAPGDFIPILEETGMIVPLGERILDAACCRIAEWREACPQLDLKVNVNLSGRQIDEPGLERLIERSLSRHALPAGALQLEFTESMIMRDVDSTHELMTALRSLGVGLAIDDFGTGYSSLSYLHRFPTDTLKIDRAFVDNLTDSSEDRNIVDTIITLGHRLDMTLVAEGIENEQQAALLREAGCQYAQGFLYSPPLSAERALELIRSAADGASVAPRRSGSAPGDPAKSTFKTPPDDAL